MEKVVLYKYLSIGDDEHFKRAFDIIINQKIFLSNGENFNDLLELAIYDKKAKEFSRIQDLRILCLTTSAKSTLMWAHYADANKGICLALEVPKEYVYPVFYTRERMYSYTNIDCILAGKNKMNPKKNLDKKYDMDEHKKYGFVKPQLWNYEHEYRIIFTESEKAYYYDEPYLRVNVKRVYFGARAEEKGNNYTELLYLCKRMNVETRKMIEADNRNGLSASVL